MATAETPHRSWNWMLQFYEDFHNDDGWSWIEPFRRLVVDGLAKSEWGQRLWASQSHHVLVISRVGTWPERVERPHVIVIPLQGTVHVRRYGAGSERLGEVEVPLTECWSEVEAALKWLEAADR